MNSAASSGMSSKSSSLPMSTLSGGFLNRISYRIGTIYRVIICGLSYATLMTLYIVPILYDVLFKKPPLSVDVGSDDDLDDIPDDAAEFIAAQGAAQPQP